MTILPSTVATLLSLAPNECLVRFGSDDGPDADYVAFIEGGINWRWDFRGLDLLVLPFAEAEMLLAEWDPRVVEPLLTGTVVVGDSSFVTQAVHALTTGLSTPQIGETLWWRGCDLLRSVFARYTHTGALPDPNPHVHAILNDASFGVALVALGREYRAAPRRPVLLRELVLRYPVLARLRATLASEKRGAATSWEQVGGLLDEAKALLVQ